MASQALGDREGTAAVGGDVGSGRPGSSEHYGGELCAGGVGYSVLVRGIAVMWMGGIGAVGGEQVGDRIVALWFCVGIVVVGVVDAKTT